ncbi:MAG: mono/diheme cytochrome c family protein [Kiritimatiellia bacterium]|jgi:mono/diheme cytochrome c family protein
MMKNFTIALMVLGLVSFVSADEASIEKGKGIYMGIGACFACHGPTGKGDGPAAVALNPKPRSFSEGVFVYDTDKDGVIGSRVDLKNIMANGTIKYGGSPLMPPRPDIQGADLDALLDYVFSLGPKKADDK